MSLLTISTNVAGEIGITVPTAVAAATDDTAVRLFNAAKTEGKMLSRRFDWPVLIKEHTFTTSASGANYDLPSDFNRLVDGTLWDRANFWRMREGLNAQQWQTLKSGIVTSGPRRSVRVRPVSGVRKIAVHPTPPTAGDTLVYEYVSDQWCQSVGGSAQSQWAADSDTGRIDEFLIQLGVRWRILMRLGMAYADEKFEYETEVRRSFAIDGGNAILNIGDSKLSIGRTEPPIFVNIPEAGFG